MIGGLIGGLVGLVGAGLQYSAQQEANQIAWANLQFQKQQAHKQYKLSTAARGDAYGNKQSYDPAGNEWVIALTPTQNQIIKAGETEQLRSLTEDATSNRILRRQQKDRSRAAVQDYTKALAGYRYNQPDSEGAIRGQILDALTQATQEASSANKGTLMMQAVRLGRGADIPKIIKAANDDTGSKLQGLINSSRDLAKNEFLQRTQAHDQRYLPEIAAFDRIIQEANPAALQPFSRVPEELSQLQQQQFAGMESAISSGSNAVGNAYATLAKSLGQSPDLSGVAKAFGSLGSGSSGRAGRPSSSGQFTSPSFAGGSSGQDWWNSPEYKAWEQFNPFANGQSSAWDSNYWNNNWDSGSLW